MCWFNPVMEQKLTGCVWPMDTMNTLQTGEENTHFFEVHKFSVVFVTNCICKFYLCFILYT